MSILLRIIPEDGFLRVVATGEFSLEEAERAFLDVINIVAEHMYEKILIDGREITGEPKTIERFFYGKFAAEMCVDFLYVIFKRGEKTPKLAPKFAYILKEPVLDPGRLGEAVATNRGMIVKAFNDLDGAQEWLGLGSANGSKVADV